jgi:tetratricopeptide (TPR) repeat protein
MEESDVGLSFAGAPGGIAELERAWASVWRVAKPERISLDVDPPRETFSQADGWLDLLRREPAAFDSLSILDDLVLLVAPISVDVDPAFDRALLVPLLERGIAIVRASLEGRDGARAPWSLALNRPPLRLLIQAAYRLEALEKTEDAAELFDWLLALNPADEHGNRGWLVNHLLRTGDDALALTTSRQRGDGLRVEAMFGEALALLRLDRASEAESALRIAVAARPLVARGLLVATLEEPVADEDGVAAGGDEEAWLYRDAMLESWRATAGALELLEGLTTATARDKRPDRPAPRRSAARAPRSRKT